MRKKTTTLNRRNGHDVPIAVINDVAALEKGGWDRVTRLLRRGDVPEEQCWLKGPDWCLAYD